MSDEKTITFPVEATHIMMFNRSIGDFSNDSMDGDFVAPPTFPQAVAQFDPDYSLRISQAWIGLVRARIPAASRVRLPPPAGFTRNNILSSSAPSAPVISSLWRPNPAEPGKRKANAPAN